MGKHSPAQGRVLFAESEFARPESGADEKYVDDLAEINAELRGSRHAAADEPEIPAAQPEVRA